MGSPKTCPKIARRDARFRGAAQAGDGLAEDLSQDRATRRAVG